MAFDFPPPTMSDPAASSSPRWNKAGIAGALAFGVIGFVAARFSSTPSAPAPTRETAAGVVQATAKPTTLREHENAGAPASASATWSEKNWRDALASPATTARNA